MPYKEKKGWRGVVRTKDRRYTRSFRTKSEAKTWEVDERRKVPNQPQKTGTDYLIEISNKYLDFCKMQYDHTTFSDKRKATKELIDITEDIPISDISPGDILDKVLMPQPTKALYNKRRKDLGAFFSHCQDFYGLQFNPIKAIKKIPIDRLPQPVPTHGEYAKLLMKVGPGQDRNLITTIAESGARRSEVFRLTWSDDVDFRERTLRLGNRKNRQRTMKYRHVPMSDESFSALQDQFKRRLPTSDYVFQNLTVWKDKSGKIVGKHPNYGRRFTARRKFIRGLCKQAKVKPLGFHSLRRYFASKLVEEGRNLEEIRGLMGHGAVSVTDGYIYRLREDLRKEVRDQRSEDK